MRVFVGNLPFSATEAEVKNMLGGFGDIKAIKMISDRETGKFRGFAFVDLDNKAAADAIDAAQDGELELGGRTIKISEATEKAPRPQGQRRDGNS